MLLNRNTTLMDNVSPNSEMNIAAWLRGLDLDRYERAFRDNDIDSDIFDELTADDLIALGITSVGHRCKLLAAIAILKGHTCAHRTSRRADPSTSQARRFTGLHANENICSAVVTASRPARARAADGLRP